MDLTKRENKLAIATGVMTTTAVAAILVIHHAESNKRKRGRSYPQISRACLQHPRSGGANTAWKQLLSCGGSGDFILTMNFDRHVFFNVLLPPFIRHQQSTNWGSPYRNGPKTRGRKTLLDPVELLGLVLYALKRSGHFQDLCLVFGIIKSTVCEWFHYGLEVINKVVKEIPEGKVKWPSVQEMQESNQLLMDTREHGHLLRGVFAVVDGGRMPCADYTDPNIQNAYYEGYTCCVEITNLFVYNFKGEIIHAGLNYPGSWHDSILAFRSGLVNPKLHIWTPCGFAILADSAFQFYGLDGKIVRARKFSENQDLPVSAEMEEIDRIMQQIMPSERQSAEWGIGCIKRAFGFLNLPMSHDSMKRRNVLTACVRLLNIRTRLVGLSQIRTVYGAIEGGAQPWSLRLP